MSIINAISRSIDGTHRVVMLATVPLNPGMSIRYSQFVRQVYPGRTRLYLSPLMRRAKRSSIYCGCHSDPLRNETAKVKAPFSRERSELPNSGYCTSTSCRVGHRVLGSSADWDYRVGHCYVQMSEIMSRTSGAMSCMSVEKASIDPFFGYS
jgi:hypothetical protein